MKKFITIISACIALMLQACLTSPSSGGRISPSSSSNLTAQWSSSAGISTDTSHMNPYAITAYTNTFMSFRFGYSMYTDSMLIKTPKYDTLVDANASSMNDTTLTLVTSLASNSNSGFHENSPKIQFVYLQKPYKVSLRDSGQYVSQHLIDSIYNANLSHIKNDSITLIINDVFLVKREDGFNAVN